MPQKNRGPSKDHKGNKGNKLSSVASVVVAHGGKGLFVYVLSHLCSVPLSLASSCVQSKDL